MDPGLCGRCVHGRPIETAKGSRFLLCEFSKVDPAFARYPPLPVLACRGFEPGPEATTMARSGSPGGLAKAAAGGAAALAATLLLPFHLGGGLGTVIAIGFLAGGVFLALASFDLATAVREDAGGRGTRVGAALGAAGFLVSGLALVGDVIERPFVPGEIAAIAATAVWWVVVWARLRGRRRWFARFTLLIAVASLIALVGQAVWEPPAGAVPARFAYVLWGPWGLWLAAVLSKGLRRRP